MSRSPKGAAAGLAAVAVIATGALFAWIFKDDIQEVFEGEQGVLLKRVETTLTMLENGLTELENQTPTSGMKKMLTDCSVDIDYLFHTLDGIKAGDCITIRSRRKALVDRANVAAERIEKLQIRQTLLKNLA